MHVDMKGEIMSNEKSSTSNREKWIKGINTAGDLVMYIGSAALATTAIRKAKENNNPLMSACAVGTGAMLSIGAGKMSSSIFNRVVDKAVEFIDDAAPKEKKNEESTVCSTENEE